MSVLDTLKKASPNRRSVTLCVDGALQAEWDALTAKLQDAVTADTAAGAGSLAMPATTQLIEDMDSIRERMAASEVTFLFEQMPWEARLALQAQHPPREKNMADRIRGLNTATFYPALIRGSCVSVTGADGDTVTEVPDEIWEGLLGDPEAGTKGSLSMGQVNQLTQAAQAVNDGETTVPPSARSLLGSRDSGASLAQPSPGTSPPADSKAGSRPTSQKSTATKKATASKARRAGS